MTYSAPPNALAAIPDELLVPTDSDRARKAQHARLERMLARAGLRPSYLDLHAEKLRRGLTAPVSDRTSKPTRSTR